MITNRETTSTNKLRLIIAATLFFAFYSSYSQINKTKVNTGVKINLEKSSPAKPARDYQSNKSNKSRPIAWTDTITENDSVPRPLNAQDYNSSRSNRPTPIREITNNDTVPRNAQDYNSSRSNKPRPIFDTAEKDTILRPAQDYNSSRSNRPKPIAWSDGVTENDSVQGPLYAQDYNSSRSNRPTPIRRTDDINDINNDEDGVVVIGKLIAIDLKDRSFELIDKKKQKITGKFQSKVTNEEINNLKRDFLNKQANIHVKINKTKLETDKEVVSYEL